jgi:hypothetical protein
MQKEDLREYLTIKKVLIQIKLMTLQIKRKILRKII